MLVSDLKPVKFSSVYKIVDIHIEKQGKGVQKTRTTLPKRSLDWPFEFDRIYKHIIHKTPNVAGLLRTEEPDIFENKLISNRLSHVITADPAVGGKDVWGLFVNDRKGSDLSSLVTQFVDASRATKALPKGKDNKTKVTEIMDGFYGRLKDRLNQDGVYADIVLSSDQRNNLTGYRFEPLKITC